MNEKQSVLSSSMEALTQNIFGMLIGFLILTWYGLSVKQSIGLQSIFFVTSYIRSFVIRRLFNKFGQEIEMKHKFLITNDVGLAKDKVEWLVTQLQSEDWLDSLESFEGEMLEALGYLEQALENLGDEE